MADILTIIPVYNGERYLPETLRSVGCQSLPPSKVVVVDDGSTDGTRGVFDRFRAEFPHLDAEWRPNPRNLGLFPNLNRCLDAAPEAEHLHLLLADDLVTPDYYATLVPALDGAPAPSMAYSLAEAIDSDSRRLRDIGPAPVAPVRDIPRAEFIGRQCDLQTVFCGSILLKTGRRAIQTRFPVEFPQVGDCVFYAELAAECAKVVEVGRRLTQIRLHGTNATSRNARNLEAFVRDEWRAMRRIEPLLGKAGIARLLHHERMKLLFAARTVVKAQLFREANPGQSVETRAIGIAEVGRLRWQAGRLAVWLRDILSGRPSY